MNHITVLAASIITLLSLSVHGAAAQGPKSYINIEAKGQLKTGIVVVGGKTTGTIIVAESGTLELDVSKVGKDKKERQALVKKLHKKDVVVKGRLTIRADAKKRPQRLIVMVTSLKEAAVKKKTQPTKTARKQGRRFREWRLELRR